MEGKDYSASISQVINGLIDASKNATFSVGFGSGGLGFSLLLLKHFEIVGIEQTLISVSAFFISARLGKAIDEAHERSLQRAKLQNELDLKELQSKLKGKSKLKGIDSKIILPGDMDWKDKG